MARDKGNQRLQIFRQFAKNFEFVRPYLEEKHGLTYQESLVACPICLTLYTEHALNQEIKNPLTIEHIPPDNLGGKGLILTCRTCNNSATKLDQTLLEYTKVKDFYDFKADSKVDANIQLNGKPLAKVEIVFKDDNIFHIKPLRNKTDSRILDYKAMVKTGKVELSLKNTNERHALIAALRIGYLFVFSRIGHPYIFNSTLDLIRLQIRNPNQDILPNLTVSRNIEEDSIDVVSIVKEPIELRSLSSGFYTSYHGVKHYTRINLPLPLQEAGDFYAKLKRFQGSGHRVEVAQLPEDVDFLTDEALADNVWQTMEYYGKEK